MKTGKDCFACSQPLCQILCKICMSRITEQEEHVHYCRTELTLWLILILPAKRRLRPQPRLKTVRIYWSEQPWPFATACNVPVSSWPLAMWFEKFSLDYSWSACSSQVQNMTETLAAFRWVTSCNNQWRPILPLPSSLVGHSWSVFRVKNELMLVGRRKVEEYSISVVLVDHS